MSSAPALEFGRYLRELRNSKQWSREDLEEFGLSKKTIERWEKGDIRQPRRSTFACFAKAFDLNVDDLIKKYRDSITSDTVQIVNYAPDNDSTFTSISRDPTEPTATSRNNWKLISIVVFCLFIISSVLAIYVLLINPRLPSNKPVIISGKVLCANNEPVEGIWADTFTGNTVNKVISGFADLRPPNSNQPEVTFVYVLKGDAYNLHVGCGGSKPHWKGTYITEAGTGPVHDHNYHFFICHDVPPASGTDYGSCDLQY